MKLLQNTILYIIGNRILNYFHNNYPVILYNNNIMFFKL